MVVPDAIWDALPVGICVLGDQMQVLQCNAAMAQMACVDGSIARGGSSLRDLGPDFAVALGPLVERVVRERVVIENVRIAVGDGQSARTLLATAFPPAPEGSGVGVVIRDITEFHQLEELRRGASRVEMIQRLAGGIAHDFNNLLTGIMANASLIREAMDAGRSVDVHIEDILRGSERAAELTRYLLAFSGQRTFIADNVDIPPILREVETKVRQTLPGTVLLEVRADEAPPRLKADPLQIADLVEILLRNAIDAVEVRGGGRVEIRVGRFQASALLEVRDDGCGISPAALPHIFEPFFTTKFLGRGLGLAAAEGIVAACGGRIEVNSAPGAGATFRVLFPARQERLSATR